MVAALTYALLALALAVSCAAGAGSSGAAPVNPVGSQRAEVSAARATVAAVERELDYQFAAHSNGTAAVSSGDDVLAEAKMFYQRLMREPVVGRDAARARGIPAKTSRPPVMPPRAPAPTDSLLGTAEHYQGVPYRWGGASGDGVDCSGLVVRAALDLGRRLPHSAAELFQLGDPVGENDLQPGDLVFFANTYKSGISHVGIYKDGSRFVQASSAAGRVTVGDLKRPYYRSRYAGARRLSLGRTILATARRWAGSAGRMLAAPWRLGDPATSG